MAGSRVRTLDTPPLWALAVRTSPENLTFSEPLLSLLGWARGGGGDPSVLDANYPPTNCWPEAPWGGGGGAWEGGSRLGGGAPGGSVGGGGGGPGGAI